jgi:hypothetical protein
MGYAPEMAGLIVTNLHFSLWVAVFVLGLACLLMRLAWEPGRLRAIPIINPWLNRYWQRALEEKHLPLTTVSLLLAINVGQLAWVAGHFISARPLALLTQSNPLVEELKSEGNRVRVSVDTSDPTLNSLLQNQFNTPAISCLQISAASRVPDALNRFFGALNDDPARLWFLAGVKNAVFPRSAFPGVQSDPAIKANIDHVDGYTLAPTISPDVPSHALVQLRDYLAKATFVPSSEIIPSDAAQLARLKDPKWDPRATVLLSANSMPAWLNRRLTPPSAYPAKAQVDLTAYDSHHIEFDVQAPAPGFVLINDAYDPDWEVHIDGWPAPLLRADYLFRALAVPPGPSHVTLDYVAHYRVAGWPIPVVAMNEFCDAFLLATWLVAALALGRGKMDRPDMPGEPNP